MKTVFSGPMALRIHLAKSGVELAKVYNCPPRSVRISIRVDDPDLPAFYFGPLMNSISVRGVWQRIYLSFPMKTASLGQMVLMTTTSNFLQPYLEDKDLENDLNADGIAFGRHLKTLGQPLASVYGPLLYYYQCPRRK